MSTLYEKHEQIGAMLPQVARDPYADDAFGRTKRFLWAQAEHTGLRPEELEEYIDGLVYDALDKFEIEDAQLFCTVFRGAIWGAVLTSTLIVQGLDPVEIEWDRVEDLDTAEFWGGYIHGSSGETVRAAGRGEDGMIVVLFNADQPHEREERWCEEHFVDRFVPVSDIPIIGGES